MVSTQPKKTLAQQIFTPSGLLGFFALAGGGVVCYKVLTEVLPILRKFSVTLEQLNELTGGKSAIQQLNDGLVNLIELINKGEIDEIQSALEKLEPIFNYAYKKLPNILTLLGFSHEDLEQIHKAIGGIETTLKDHADLKKTFKSLANVPDLLKNICRYIADIVRILNEKVKVNLDILVPNREQNQPVGK
jgi:hypothetical protein